MPTNITQLHSYRCSYHPQYSYGNPPPVVSDDNGDLPYIQFKAPSADAAQKLARHITGCMVCIVERIEGGAA